jgi:hypothetical protein
VRACVDLQFPETVPPTEWGTDPHECLYPLLPRHGGRAKFPGNSARLYGSPGTISTPTPANASPRLSTPYTARACAPRNQTPAAAPPSRDLPPCSRRTLPAAQKGRDKRRQQACERTCAAARSSSAALAAVEWSRWRSTRCSCRCSANPRSFRSDDFISVRRIRRTSPPLPSNTRPDRRPPGFARGRGQTLAAVPAPRTPLPLPPLRRKARGRASERESGELIVFSASRTASGSFPFLDY